MTSSGESGTGSVAMEVESGGGPAGEVSGGGSVGLVVVEEPFL
jgi:hypothetical protein